MKPHRMAWYVFALIVVALLAVGPLALADETTVEIDCNQYAGFAASITSYRDAEAKLEKVLAMLREANKGADLDVIRAFEAEARRVWAEGLSREEAGIAAHQRCIERLGQWPRKVED